MSQRNDYTAIAAQTVFTYTFQIFEDDEIQVFQNESLASLGIDYTVSNNALPAIGGTITLLTPALAGDLVSLVQAIPIERLITYQTDGDWQAVTVNEDFNRLYTLLVQAFGTSSDPNAQISDRLLRFPTSENRDGKNNFIPSPVDNTILAWTNGELVNQSIPSLSASSAPVVPNVATLKAVDVTVNQSARIEGINISGDGGVNAFYYDAGSALPDNGTTVITPNVGGGRWLALPAGTEGIADNSLTTDKYINGSVTSAKLATDVFEAVYPVGSLYLNAAVSTNPATLLGFGTWVAHAEGRVLVGVGSTTDDRGQTKGFSLGAEAGEFNHVLTESELAAHDHPISDSGHSHNVLRGTGGGSDPDHYQEGPGVGVNQATSSSTTGISVNNAGGNTPHNNEQPSIAVYIWQRTA